MADLTDTQDRMGLVSAAAVAVAAWSAAATGLGVGLPDLNLPLAVVAAGLVAGVVAVATRRSPIVLPPGKDVVVLTAVTVAGFVGLYLAGWTDRGHVADVARLLPLAVVGLSVLWPEPNVLRYCLLLAGGTLVGAATEPIRSRPAVGAALVAISVALVATSRLTAAGGPRLGGAAPATRRRVASEAIAVLAIVGLLAALAASLVPPPPGRGGDGLPNGNGRRRLPSPAGPPVQFGDTLDVGGGRPKPSNQPVLLVNASRADLWRALTYDHWDGESWSRAPEERTFLEDDTVVPGIGDIENDPGVLGFFQSITLLARAAAVLPAAARPTNAAPFNRALQQGADTSLYASPAMVRGEEYTVFSDQPSSRAGALRAAGDTPASAVPADVADAYLQLPKVAPRVRALAAEIVAGRPTTYDKVKAVERWIVDNTRVTDDAKPVPAGADPLETFLLVDRAGPAERAATSMAVMLRAVGIPARIAVGFLPGRRTGADGAFLVRASDSHAWVEVWFPGRGWQRFDATGRAPDPRARADSIWDRLLRFLRSLWPLFVTLIVVAIGWMGRRSIRWWRRRAALPWSTRFFARVERAGAARGRPRQPQETPAEYANGLARGVLADPRLEEVGRVVTVAAWSKHEPPAEDRARAEAVLRAATKATPVRRLARLRRR